MQTRSCWIGLLFTSWLLAASAAPNDCLAADREAIFSRDRLVAWCIVPFDAKKRGPEERAEMLQRLGFKHFAYDWRGEHIPTFDAEIAALKKRGIALDAWWFPAALNDEARAILAALQRGNVHTQLWITLGDPAPAAKTNAEKITAAANILRPIALEADKIGCTIALYNHGGWFGDTDNQIAIINELKLKNVGIVYNQHHGHDDLKDFAARLKRMLPHLWCLNLNGMVVDGERRGQKILPLGQGDLDLELLKTIRDSGYAGPIGILGHTQDDAEQRLQDNLDGLDWLLPQLAGKPAGTKPKPRTPAPTGATAVPAGKPKLGDGKFGKSLDAREGGVMIAGKAEYRKPPLTLECWAKLNEQKGFNILAASDLKTSAAHWELFTWMGDGTLTVYLPGMKPDHVRSTADVVDGQWHYLAMIYEPERVRLLVDGKQVADQRVKFQNDAAVDGDLAIGQLVGRELFCDGWVDEVRLSRGARELKGIPDAPFPADDATLGLWHFDQTDDKQHSPDASPLKNPAKLAAADGKNKSEQKGDHYGVDILGFKWTEQDSVDGRWQQVDIGRFLASILPLSEGPVRKGLSIRLGKNQDAAICFDTEHCGLRAAWTGDFLRFDPARFGLINAPQPAGKLQFSAKAGAGWDRPVRYSGMHLHGERVALSYQVDGVMVRESPWIETNDGQVVFVRTLEIGPSDKPLRMQLQVAAAGSAVARKVDDVAMTTITQADVATAFAVLGDRAAELDGVALGERVGIGVKIAPHAEKICFQLLFTTGEAKNLNSLEKVLAHAPGPKPLDDILQNGPPRWGEPLLTPLVQGKETGPFVVDTLTIPFENPFHALFFLGGHDFFSNGDIAVCTIHGDVWRVSDATTSLPRINWQRMATGLFQPLGLKIINDQVYVLGRDQITRLIDRNRDGEADDYENFSNLYLTSEGGHDYVAGLETDSQGNFYLVHAKQGLVRISADGTNLEIVATGFRNPVGLSVGPNDEITVSPQEGEWTPNSNIAWIKPGGHYGFGGPQVTPQRPLGYDPPLCWIPRMQDNSSGGQTWITSDRWGNLKGQLLHFSFGKCRAMLALREQVGDGMQGGVVELPLNFDSGVLHGRFSPRDGQLYVSGMKGWVTSAAQDGCLQRVRYREKDQPVALPLAVRTYQNGIAIKFTRPLDRETAEDLGSYHLEACNYRYSASYGSPDLKPSDPKQEGREELPVLSATLLPDGQTVFLELAGFRPAQQLIINYSLTATDNAPLRQAIYYTVNAVGGDTMPVENLHRSLTKSNLDPASLRPGLITRFRQEPAGKDVAEKERRDARLQRLAALYVAPQSPPTPFLSPGKFTAQTEGFIHAPLRETYQFRCEGSGSVRLTINGKTVIAEELAAGGEPKAVILHKGFNKLEIQYTSPGASVDAAWSRLLWSSDSFAEEAVPPTALFCRADDLELAQGYQRRMARELFARQQCHRCHLFPKELVDSPSAMPELKLAPPSLKEIGSRLSADWLAAWLMQPGALRMDATMPQMLDPADPQLRQKAADLAVYLGASSEPSPPEAAPAAELVERGEAVFLELGCIACHQVESPVSEPDEHHRLSLWLVNAKFRPAALADYLRRPHLHHAASKMPDFHLSAEEVAALTAYLRSRVKGTVPPAAELKTASAERGRELAGAVRCFSCHAPEDAPKPAPALVSPMAISRLDQGCLAEAQEARAAAPDHRLQPSQRQALAALLKEGTASLLQDSPAEASQRLIVSLHCGACHTRDGQASPRGPLIAEAAGLAPELLPNLTWTGEKLRSAWLFDFLTGKVADRPRPWLKARMPAYSAYAAALALGLPNEHGLPVHEPSPGTRPSVGHEIEIGRKLVQADALDCRQCHGIGPEQPRGDARTQIAPGINFAHARERLHHDFYTRFTLDPPRYDVGTKMPKLSADGKTTKIRAIYEGDARRQLESIWQYIQTVEKARP